MLKLNNTKRLLVLLLVVLLSTVGTVKSAPLYSDVVIGDDEWIGLGAAAGRIVFDDQAVDEVLILDARMGVDTETPSFSLEVGDDSGAADYFIGVGSSGHYSAGLLFRRVGVTDASVIVDSNEDLILTYGEGDIWGRDLRIERGSGGTLVAIFDQDNNVGIGDDTPSYKLDADGDIRATGDLRAGDDLFVTDDADIGGTVLVGDTIGINDPTPSYPLDVNGDVRATGDIYANDDVLVDGDIDVGGSVRAQVSLEAGAGAAEILTEAEATPLMAGIPSAGGYFIFFDDITLNNDYINLFSGFDSVGPSHGGMLRVEWLVKDITDGAWYSGTVSTFNDCSGGDTTVVLADDGSDSLELTLDRVILVDEWDVCETRLTVTGTDDYHIYLELAWF